VYGIGKKFKSADVDAYGNYLQGKIAFLRRKYVDAEFYFNNTFKYYQMGKYKIKSLIYLGDCLRQKAMDSFEFEEK